LDRQLLAEHSGNEDERYVRRTLPRAPSTSGTAAHSGSRSTFRESSCSSFSALLRERRADTGASSSTVAPDADPRYWLRNRMNSPSSRSAWRVPSEKCAALIPSSPAHPRSGLRHGPRSRFPGDAAVRHRHGRRATPLYFRLSLDRCAARRTDGKGAGRYLSWDKKTDLTPCGGDASSSPQDRQGDPPCARVRAGTSLPSCA
jgi:hypothetical protein